MGSTHRAASGRTSAELLCLAERSPSPWCVHHPRSFLTPMFRGFFFNGGQLQWCDWLNHGSLVIQLNLQPPPLPGGGGGAKSFNPVVMPWPPGWQLPPWSKVPSHQSSHLPPKDTPLAPEILVVAGAMGMNQKYGILLLYHRWLFGFLFLLTVVSKAIKFSVIAGLIVS